MSRIPLRILISFVIAIAILLVSTAQAQTYQIVLRVNERIATTYDYQKRRAENLRIIRASELSTEQEQEVLANLGVSTMNDIFQELLLLSRADQLNLNIDELEIREAIEEQKQAFGITTDEEFKQALAASNMNIDDMRANLERDLLIRRVIGEEIRSRVSVSEEDLRRYYQTHSDQFQEEERLHLREVVLLGSSGLKADELMLLATEIRQQLINGGTLEEVAAPYVEQGMSSSAVDLGWVTLGDLDRDLEEAVWSLESGGVSEAIPGRGGLHILQVAERQEAKLQDFASVKDAIGRRENGRRMRDEMAQYAAELEAKAYVVVNPPPEAAGFRVGSDISSDDLAVALTAPLMTEPEGNGEENGESIDQPEVQEPGESPEDGASPEDPSSSG